jgi:hypothetical protein
VVARKLLLVVRSVWLSGNNYTLPEGWKRPKSKNLKNYWLIYKAINTSYLK